MQSWSADPVFRRSARAVPRLRQALEDAAQALVRGRRCWLRRKRDGWRASSVVAFLSKQRLFQEMPRERCVGDRHSKSYGDRDHLAVEPIAGEIKHGEVYEVDLITDSADVPQRRPLKNSYEFSTQGPEDETGRCRQSKFIEPCVHDSGICVGSKVRVSRK
jgi:hypothetical protein